MICEIVFAIHSHIQSETEKKPLMKRDTWSLPLRTGSVQSLTPSPSGTGSLTVRLEVYEVRSGAKGCIKPHSPIIRVCTVSLRDQR
jgi:hypothetical protein